MAIELARYLDERLTWLPPNDPDRILLEKVAKETDEHLHIMRLAVKLQQAFGSLPDETLMLDFIPPFFRVSIRTGKVRSGRFAGMTKEEAHAEYPVWGEIYSNAEQLEKYLLTGLTAHVVMIGKRGINTLGELRNASNEELFSATGAGASSKSFLLLRAGFTHLPTTSNT